MQPGMSVSYVGRRCSIGVDECWKAACKRRFFYPRDCLSAAC